MFNGRPYDSETGLYYYRTRYLDPRTGRFTTRDRLGIWGDPQNLGNGYTYVNNNPWTLLDPYGLGGMFAAPRGGGMMRAGQEMQRAPHQYRFYARPEGVPRPSVPDELVWERHQDSQLDIRQARGDLRFSDLRWLVRQLLDWGSASVPVVNDARDWSGFVTGIDPVTREELSDFERTLFAAGVFIGNGRWFKKIKDRCAETFGPAYNRLRRGNGGRGGGPDHGRRQEFIRTTAGGSDEVWLEEARRAADNLDADGRIHQIGDMRSRGGYRPSGD